MIAEDENAYRDLEREVQKATIELNDLNNSMGRIRDVISNLEAANEKSQEEIDRNTGKVQELLSERARLEEENAVLSSDSDVDEMNALLEREQGARSFSRRLGHAHNDLLEQLRCPLDDINMPVRDRVERPGHERAPRIPR